MTSELILASKSPYRKKLLERLGYAFQTMKPTLDEDRAKLQGLQANLTPVQIAQALARGKALSLASPNNCVIGADQLVALDNKKILGQPGSPEKAKAQLLELQGRSHELITAVAVVCGDQKREFLDRSIMHVRPLTADEIESYIRLDNPIDCAGSYKFEFHGISLFSKIECADPSAIEGLPLIELHHHLRELGKSKPWTKLS